MEDHGSGGTLENKNEEVEKFDECKIKVFIIEDKLGKPKKKESLKGFEES